MAGSRQGRRLSWLISPTVPLAFRDGLLAVQWGYAAGPATRRNRAKSFCEYLDNPAECSGPPHLLGPWGSAGTGRCEWPPHDTVPGRPPFPQSVTTRMAGAGPAIATASARRCKLLDLGLAKFGVLLGDRIVFLLHQFIGH